VALEECLSRSGILGDDGWRRRLDHESLGAAELAGLVVPSKTARDECRQSAPRVEEPIRHALPSSVVVIDRRAAVDRGIVCPRCRASNVFDVAKRQGEAVGFREGEARGTRVVWSRVSGARNVTKVRGAEGVWIQALAAQSVRLDLIRNLVFACLLDEVERATSYEFACVRGQEPLGTIDTYERSVSCRHVVDLPKLVLEVGEVQALGCKITRAHSGQPVSDALGSATWS
jgi:hypothetical protein